MANLSYNYNIFTNVHKWDNDYTYLGITVSGKLNQYNGQGYPILDAIDIDWNGAYVSTLNSYVYTTEDLINLFNRFGRTEINLRENYYTKDEFDSTFRQYQELIGQELDDMTYIMEETIVQNLLSRYDVLNAISEILIDRARYLEVPYENIVQNHRLTNYAKERTFFIYDEVSGVYNEIKDINYILDNPQEKFYIFIMNDIIKINDNIEDIYNILGSEEYDETTYTYTYTGFYQRFNNVESDLSYLTYYLDNNTTTTIEAYNYAYSSYLLSNKNSELIGYHTRYNVYERVEDLNSSEFYDYLYHHTNNIFIKNPNNESEYISIRYTGNPNYEYYMLHEKINGTGIEKEIEDINNQIEDNSYILYHLYTKSNSTYINLNIKPENTVNRTIDRTITIDIQNSYVNDNTGEITHGIANQNTIIDSVSYLFGWEILKK